MHHVTALTVGKPVHKRGMQFFDFFFKKAQVLFVIGLAFGIGFDEGFGNTLGHFQRAVRGHPYMRVLLRQRRAGLQGVHTGKAI